MTIRSPNIWQGQNTSWTTAANWSAGIAPAQVTGTAQAGAASTITLAAGDTAATGDYVNSWIVLTGGTGAGQTQRITANDGSSKIATVASAWSVNPNSSTTYRIEMDILLSNATAGIASGDQSAVSLYRLNADMSMIGLVAEQGTYLKLAAGIVNVGTTTPAATGNGSRRMNLWMVGASAVTVYGTATRGSDSNLPPLILTGDTLSVVAFSGNLAIAPAANETGATVPLLETYKGTGVPTIYVGPNVTIQTCSHQSGTLTVMSQQTINNVTTLNSGTTYVFAGTATHTALTVGAGSTVDFNGAGTVTTLDVTGTLDLSGGSGTVTVTNKAHFRAGCTVLDPLGRLVLSGGFDTPNCTLNDVTLNFGVARTFTVA